MRYEEMIEGIGRDMEVPKDVRLKFEQALADLPEKEAGKKRRRGFGAGRKLAVSAAAVLAVSCGVCYTNPALAAKIPILGNIFSQVEEKVTYKGDYSSKSELLTAEQTEEAPSAEAGTGAADAESRAAEISEYSAADNGVKVTASEIYCDGISLFLTAEIEVEDGRLTHIPGYQYQQDHHIEDESLIMYTRGTWNIKGMKNETRLANDNFEGTVLDDHTFIGMLKLDLHTLEASEGVLELAFTSIGYDDDAMLYAEDISESHRIEGTWEFEIPFHVDDEQVKEVEINQMLDNGYAIEKAVISPYQFVVYADAPYFEAYDSYDFCGAVVYDAQQEKLEQGKQIIPVRADGSVDPDGAIRHVFALQGRDISEATICLFDDFDSWVDGEKEGLDAAKEYAVLSAEVSF